MPKRVLAESPPVPVSSMYRFGSSGVHNLAPGMAMVCVTVRVSPAASLTRKTGAFTAAAGDLHRCTAWVSAKATGRPEWLRSFVCTAMVCRIAARRHLDAFDRRVAAEPERDAVIDAGRPAVLLEVGAGREGSGQHPRMGAHPHHNFVLTLAQLAGNVDDRSRKARQMLAHLLAVHPHGRAELRLIDAQCGDAAQGPHLEPPPVPEPIALLPRDAGIRHQRGGGSQAARHAILQQLPAFELVHVRKSRHGQMRQPRHRRAMRIHCRQRVRRHRIGDLPLPVKGQRDALGSPERDRQQGEKYQRLGRNGMTSET